MINAQVYGLNKCSTCHKAMAWLDEHGVAYQFADYRDNPIDSRTLCAWASAVGGWEKLVNRASMTWRNLPLEKKSPQGQEQWLALIAQFPRSEAHTSELQSLMRSSYAVFCLTHTTLTEN